MKNNLYISGAINILRSQLPIAIKQKGSYFVRIYIAQESPIIEELLNNELKNNVKNLRLLITGNYANFLGRGHKYESELCDIDLPLPFRRQEVNDIANPVKHIYLSDKFSSKQIMPNGFQEKLMSESSNNVSDDDKMAIRLIQQCELLPSLIAFDIADEYFQEIDTPIYKIDYQDISDMIASKGEYRLVEKISEAQLPINNVSKIPDIRIYREIGSYKEHFALCFAEDEDFNGKNKDEQLNYPLIRVHSSSVTGDILSSARCDCGGQLSDAIQQIALHPAGGAVIYIIQEGRGIGLANKIMSYQLQDKYNLNTAQANEALGFDADNRDFEIVADILNELDIEDLCLLSNNPNKAQEIKEAGINVRHMVALQSRITEYNQSYLDSKPELLGHIPLETK